MVTKSSNLSTSARVRPPPRGITVPSRKPPNNAWIPIASVTVLDTRSSAIDPAITSGDNEVAPRGPSRASSGRTARTMSAVYASAIAVVARPDARPSAFTIATTIASTLHALTSSIAAEASAITPTGVLSRCRSPRIRASTGKAVMLMDTPRNRANDVTGVPGGARLA
jgi:hypothetical protein